MNEVLKRRYQVFVSSTYSDLIEERKHVIQALLETKCIPVGMELFPAASDDQWTLIKRVIDDCDYYIVIVAGKYGSCGADGRSYTEMEFDYALQSDKPVLGFYHENLDLLQGSKLEKNDAMRESLEAFTAKVKMRMCKPWHNADGLASAIKSSMLYAIEHHPRPGWIRADTAADPDFVNRLKQRIAELEAGGERPKKAKYADGETSLQLPVNIRYAKWRDSERSRWDWCNDQQTINTTLGEIFSVIAPRLMEKRSRIGLKKMVNHWLESHLQQRLSELSDVSRFHPSVDLDLDAFCRVLDTFVANKLLKRVTPPSHVKTTDLYWQLTSSGVQRMAEQRALPPERDGAASAQ